MRHGTWLGVAAMLLVMSGCARSAPTLIVPSTPPVQSAAAKAATITVMRNPEAGPGLLGSFNLISGRGPAETLRFFGNRSLISQATVQMGNEPPRAINATEAQRYAELLGFARPDAQTRELLSLLQGWASRRTGGAPTSTAMAAPRPLTR